MFLVSMSIRLNYPRLNHLQIFLCDFMSRLPHSGRESHSCIFFTLRVAKSIFLFQVIRFPCLTGWGGGISTVEYISFCGLNCRCCLSVYPSLLPSLLFCENKSGQKRGGKLGVLFRACWFLFLPFPPYGAVVKSRWPFPGGDQTLNFFGVRAYTVSHHVTLKNDVSHFIKSHYSMWLPDTTCASQKSVIKCSKSTRGTLC
jgi:hypothetical protein